MVIIIIITDLTEFVDALVIVVRSCTTEAPAGSPPPPTQMPGKILEMPAATRKILFDQSFFSSLVEMDYNTPAVAELCRHLSWHAADRSDIVVETIVSQFDKGPTVKYPVFEQLLEAVLAMDDAPLQERRIRRALTTFKMQSIISSHHNYAPKFKGLLAVAQELHDRRDIHALDIVRFIAKMAFDNVAVRDYLLRRPGDIQWITEYLESKFEDEEPQVRRVAADELRQDAEAGIVTKLVPLHRRENAQALVPELQTLPQWKTSGLYATLVFFHALAKDKPSAAASGSSGANDDLILQQQETINQLQKKLDTAEKENKVVRLDFP
jgi:hypothetical protein